MGAEMDRKSYKALVVEEFSAGKFRRSVKQRNFSDLGANGILIKVKYSSLNYKDGLSARGHKGITRKYPHTPGIDAAGIIEESNDNLLPAGMEVLVTGYDLGMNTNGGFSQYIRVPAEWIVPLPKGLTPGESMMIGTAGFTAGLCINEILNCGIAPDMGRVLVTGASGGVGSLAVSILSKIGFEVTASTGKKESYKMLKEIGAKEIVDRSEVYDMSGKPLLSGRWVAAIDNVGGNTLSSVIRSVKPWGAICVVGNVESDKFECSVYPFILRGIKLIGIDSAEKKMTLRAAIWNKLAGEWKPDNLAAISREIVLDDIGNEIQSILEGRITGRVLVRI